MGEDWHSKAFEVFGYRIGGYINHNAIAKLFEQIDGALLGDNPVVLSITLNAEEEDVRPIVTASKRIAPWPDYAGNPIHEGDTLRHPDGETGTVVFLGDRSSDGDAWRVKYHAVLARLNLQIGDKGQGVVVDAPQSAG